jgi:hypothetical protein
VKKLQQIATVLPLVAFAAAAQDEPRLREHLVKLESEAQAMQMKVQAIGAVNGASVKGAPYSGEEVNETNQVLADGTRIHRETRTMVYRDSEGRTRRETPENITIVDPVAKVTYLLNPKTMTGQKLNMSAGTYSYMRDVSSSRVSSSNNGANATFTMRMESDGGTPTLTINGRTLDPKQVEELMAKAKATGDHTVTIDGFTINPLMDGPDKVMMADKATAVAGGFVRVWPKKAGESIGAQMIEGVHSEGTRSVNTIKAGSIGNDRDIQVLGESWYSPELQTTIMSKHSDPRSGEESFRLTGISRNEPGSYLFQPPAGYTINERK